MKTITGDSATPKTQILINVVLDRSGSMSACRKSTIDGYNEYLKGLSDDKDTDYNITLIQFDSPGGHRIPALTISYVDKPLAEVPMLSEKTYEPRGGTPLYDAVGECIRRANANGRGVITVIVTDGAENASKEFSLTAIKALITQKENDEGWKFVFLGANIDAVKTGASMGVAAGASADFDYAGVSNTYRTMASNSLRYASAVRIKGLHSTEARVSMNFDKKQRDSMKGGRQAEPTKFHEEQQ